jgi:hypothetical protein
MSWFPTLNANSVSVFLNLSPTTKDFTVSATALEPSSLNPGQSSTATIDISATSTFNGTVTLHCSISPQPANAPQCSVAPASIEPGALANLTIRTTAPSAARARRENRGFTGSSGLCSVAFGLLFVGLTQKRKREAWSRSVSMLAGCSLMVFILIFEIACGGSNRQLGGKPVAVIQALPQEATRSAWLPDRTRSSIRRARPSQCVRNNRRG